MNFKEIVEKLDQLEVSKDEFAHEDWDRKVIKETFGEVKEVFHKGGSGQGEEWSVVRYFADHDVYIRLDGFYTSYDGANFDDDEYFEVFPQTKTITIYEA